MRSVGRRTRGGVARNLAPGTSYGFTIRKRLARGYGKWYRTRSVRLPPRPTAPFVQPLDEVAPVAGGIPTLTVDTAGGAPIVSKDDYLNATYSLSGNADPARDVSGTTEIKGRGNSTWDRPKKPYRLKLSAKQPLFGFPSSRHWVLLANHYDKSRIRNAIAMHLGRQTGLAWTPRDHFVRLRLNGVDAGLYELFEHVRVDPDRIAIDELKATDNSGAALTGGYQIELDGWRPAGEQKFETDRLIPFTFKSPEEPTTEQRSYIVAYVQDAEDAIYDRTNYADFIDIDSWINWYIVCELLKNQDSGYSSVNYYKPRNGKIFMGPLWDFDQSLGGSGWGSNTTDSWWVRDGLGNGVGRNKYFHELFNDPVFAAKFRARWIELEPKLKSIYSFVDSLGYWLAPDAVSDGQLWPGSVDFAAQLQFIKNWLAARFDWIDANLPPAT